MLTFPVDRAALQALTDNEARESSTLDFKSEFIPDDANHRRGLIDDVCALANTHGGVLLLGVSENQGVASGLPGLAIADADAFRLRIAQIIESGLEPRLSGIRFEFIPVENGRSVVAIRVPQSWVAPHRTSGSRRFMVRGDGGNTEYDIHGLRQAFLAGTAAAEAWERFREGRVGRFYAGRLPLNVKAGPAAFMHLFPVSSVGSGQMYDMHTAGNSANFLPGRDDGRAARPNLEGVVRRGREDNELSENYVQVFRNGAVESFLLIDPGVRHPGLALSWVEQDVGNLLPNWLRGMAELNVPGPFQFGVTLVGVCGMRPIRDEAGHPLWGIAPRDDTLFFPAWLIESPESDVRQIATEFNTLVFNAFGRNPP